METHWLLRSCENRRGKTDIKYIIFAIMMLCLIVWMSYLIWIGHYNAAMKILGSVGGYAITLVGASKYGEHQEEKNDIEREKIKKEIENLKKENSGS